jgi:transposase-like protein
LPRARLGSPAGTTQEWQSAVVPRYQRRTGRVDEAGDELFTFTRFPVAPWRALRTTNAIERIDEEFRRRVKTQGSLPSQDAVMLLLFGLLRSGQIKLRALVGYHEMGKVAERSAA